MSFAFRRLKSIVVQRLRECLRGAWWDCQIWDVFRWHGVQAADPRAEHPELEFHLVAGGDAVAALAARGYCLGDAALAADLTVGARGWADCFLIFSDRQLVHASQVATDPHNPEVVQGMLSQAGLEAVCVGPCVTPLQFRGRGYYPLALRWICWHYGGQGRSVVIRARKAPSVAGIRKAGFKAWRRVTHRRWLVFSNNSYRPWEGDP